jgi:RecA-family ATPase
MNIEERVSLIKQGAGGSRKKMHVTNHRRDNYYLDVFSYKDIESLNLPVQEVLLSNLWRTEENVMVYSKTGVGKSWLSLSIATCIAGKGKMNVCDWENEISRKVLLVDGEMSVRDYQNRLPVLIDATKADAAKVRENLDFVPRQRQEQYEYFTNLANENNQSELINYAKSRSIDTLILDNLSTLTEFDNENNSESMKLFQKFLLRARSEGLQTMVVHHMRKGKEDDESYRGSSVLGVSLDTILRLESPDNGSPDGTVTFIIIDEKKGILQLIHGQYS